MVQRREKEKDSRYIQEASAPAAVTVYQTCNIMYICNIICCMCTCIVSLTAQVRLICSWCMKICLRRAARISAERLISVQTDEQTEIDMETNMAVNMGDKPIYIRAFWPREDQ